MSRHSAEARWEFHQGDTSCYYFYNKRVGGLFDMNISRVDNLHSIVHEINECEIMYALKKLGVGDVDIHVTRKMCKKYPWLFHRPAKNIVITHILSPYGRGNCALPRKENRIVW